MELNHPNAKIWEARNMGDHPMPEIEVSVIGNYEVDSGIVTVTYNGRKKSTQLGGSPAEYIAQRLLREILEDPAGRFSNPA